MLSYLDFVSASPDSIGFKLDLFAACSIYMVLGTLATIILLNQKLSLKERFNTIAVPISIFFLALVLSLGQRLDASKQ